MGILDFLFNWRTNTELAKYKGELEIVSKEREGLREDIARLREDLNAKVVSLNSLSEALKNYKELNDTFKKENEYLRKRIEAIENRVAGQTNNATALSRDIGYNEAKILSLLSNNPNLRMSAKDIRRELNCSRSTAYIVISNLIEKGKVDKLGSEKKSYILIKQDILKAQNIGQEEKTTE